MSQFHHIYADSITRSGRASQSSTPQNNMHFENSSAISISDLTSQQLFGGGIPISTSRQGSRRGSLRPSATPGLEAARSALGVAGVVARTTPLHVPVPQGPVMMDPAELEQALLQTAGPGNSQLEGGQGNHDAQHQNGDEYSSFNPFSLSNSNSNNIDQWDSELDFSALPTIPSPESRRTNPLSNPPHSRALTLPLPQTQTPIQLPQPSPYNMNPNDQNQYYYNPPPVYPPYAHSYAASSGGPSNPTSPQNGYLPIYPDNPASVAAAAAQQSTPLYSPYASSINGGQGDQPPSPQTLEEHELKRLRNTAASARFRAKKKQREAQLESAAREKKERLEALEKRIHDLEEENKWLKALIMEKKDVAGEVARLRERFGRVEEEMREFDGESKKGVGTSASANVSEAGEDAE